MRIYNNREAFGDGGPFEAPSFGAFVDDMAPSLECYLDEQEHNAELDGQGLGPRSERRVALHKDLRAGLSVVCPRCGAHGPTGDDEWICGATFGCPGY